jgi:apolipoprotein D and lipocalin family protein
VIPAFGLMLGLAACVGTGPKPEARFRDPQAPIWSAAAFQPAQIAGDWRQVAGFQADSRTCTKGAVTFRPVAGGLEVTGALCLDGTPRKVSGLATPSGPGRLQVRGMEDWWILWVDSGYRTLAVGTPSGAFGFVLDRASASSDRLVAAREVMDFNGYAPTAFRAF